MNTEGGGPVKQRDSLVSVFLSVRPNKWQTSASLGRWTDKQFDAGAQLFSEKRSSARGSNYLILDSWWILICFRQILGMI